MQNNKTVQSTERGPVILYIRRRTIFANSLLFETDALWLQEYYTIVHILHFLLGVDLIAVLACVVAGSTVLGAAQIAGFFLTI